MADLASLLPRPLRALAIRFDKSPIATVEALVEFDRTRASYVAQTTLFGYLKTRMGTQFASYFQDDEFSRSIRAASAKLYVSCLGDLTVFAVGLCAPAMEAERAATLAERCFAEGFRRTLTDLDPEYVPEDAVAAFAARAALTAWDEAANGINAFSGSEADIVRFAPVVDEFKELDREIVSNSIRFRWRDVREQLRKRIDAPAIATDWKNHPGANRSTAP